MAFYDEYANHKISKPGRILNEYFYSMINSIVDSYVAPEGSIVEIGVGQGGLAYTLHEKYTYSGYELNPSLVEYHCNNGLHVCNKAVPPLAEGDTTVDAVLAIHVVEHMIHMNAAIELLKEIHRVLKKPGFFILITPDFLDQGRLFYDVDYSHNFVTTPNRLTQLARDSGFDIVLHKFMYGSLPMVPGLALNMGIKLLFLLLNPFFRNTRFERRGFQKLEHLCSRCILLVCRKKA